MQAAMMYLRVLREGRGLSRPALEKRTGINQKQIYRWERGDHRPPASSIALIVGALDGDVDVVQELLADDKATALDGERLAKKLLGPSVEERVQQLIQAVDPAERDAILDEVRAEIDKDASLLVYLRDLLTGRRARLDGDRHD